MPLNLTEPSANNGYIGGRRFGLMRGATTKACSLQHSEEEQRSSRPEMRPPRRGWTLLGCDCAAPPCRSARLRLRPRSLSRSKIVSANVSIIYRRLSKYRVTLIVFVISLVSAATAFGAASAIFNGQINAEKINVRVDATVGSAVICSLPKDALVEVVSEAHDWYKIRLPNEAPSYVKDDLVECINSDPASNPGRCLSAKVIKERINIRVGPGESTWILGKADKSTVLNILAQVKGWYKIQPIYQSYGWVNKKFVSREALHRKQEAAEAPEQALQSPDFLVVEGAVSPYGVVLWRKATHKLITSENKVYLLKGNRKALDSLNYHKVKVSGKLITSVNTEYPIIEVSEVSVSS